MVGMDDSTATDDTMMDVVGMDDSTAADDTTMVGMDDTTAADDTTMTDDTTMADDDSAVVDDTTMDMPMGPVCGNGMMEMGEACDDGNMDPGDGCEPDCTPTPAPAVSIETLVPDLDGWWVQTPCGDQPNSDDCAGGGWAVNGGQSNACQGGALNMDLEYDVGGEPGKVYDVAMHFYGVMEPRQYNGVEREAQGAPSRNEGGMPTPWATADPGTNYRSLGDNNYNTYEIHVFNDAGQEMKMYFLNADTGTGHYTMAISYEKTIQVYGGGKVQLVVYDANCRQIKNCGPNGGNVSQCAGNAVTINIGAADPQPMGLTQPGLGQPDQHAGQWWLIDVLSVAEAGQ
jgi:cysteine-rich repeat protein